MSQRKKKTKKIGRPETLAERIGKAARGLYYISETDAEIAPFVGEKACVADAETLLRQIKSSEPVEERNFEDFFKRLTEIQEWFGTEETANANKFNDLKRLLEENLRGLKVFKVGKIELDIFVVGLDKEDILTGIHTKAVET
jgi:hypothetical protein